MPSQLAEMLIRHVDALGVADDRTAWLFPAPKGGPLAYGNFLRRVWYPARTKAGLPTVGFHDLRRTAITAMVAAGVDVKTAQARPSPCRTRRSTDDTERLRQGHDAR